MCSDKIVRFVVRVRLLRILDREKRVVTGPLRLVTKLLESHKKVLKSYPEESRVSTIFNPTIITLPRDRY